MKKCRLCLKQRPLLKKSHIIPEFMYHELFDNHHKFLSFSPYEHSRGSKKIKRPSSGEYESNILCVKCDNDLLGSYEDYAKRVIYGGYLASGENPICENYSTQEGLKFTTCSNINYKKFKIFLLSILWRASISSRPFFKLVKLNEHEEIIRSMILDGNAGTTSTYPILFMTYVNDKSMPTDFIVQPQKRIISGLEAYVFIIGGMIYIFFINSKGNFLPDFILSQTIKPTNEMNILHIPEGRGLELIFRFYGITLS